ncbi:MAG TPA: hypothetical protein VGB96_03970, partial [Archangium sp.]
MILLSRLMPCLLCLLLLTPGMGFAAASRLTLLPSALGGPRGQEMPLALRLQEPPEESESEPVRRWRPHGVFRVAAELGVGA